MRLPRAVRLALVATTVPILVISLAPHAEAHTPSLRHVFAAGVFAAPSVATNAFDSTLDAAVGAPDLVPPGAAARSTRGTSQVVARSWFLACAVWCLTVSTARTRTRLPAE